MSIVENLKLSLKKLGLRGTFQLLAEMKAKKRRLAKLLSTNPGFVKLIAQTDKIFHPSDEEIATIIERADEMLQDENYVFTFLHHLKNIPDVWNYDPLEKKFW